MKKIILSTLLIAGLAFGTVNAVNAEQKIAIIDAGAVAAQSAQVQALKKEQQSKMIELEKWIVSAKADVEKQQTKEGKEKVLKKYDADFVKKQEAIIKNYQTKLKAIDDSISGTIAKYAKEHGYDAVFTKGVVLYGGVDITEDIKKIVK